MKFRGGEFSTGTTGNFHSELTVKSPCFRCMFFVTNVLPHVQGLRVKRYSTCFPERRGELLNQPTPKASRLNPEFRGTVYAGRNMHCGRI